MHAPQRFESAAAFELQFISLCGARRALAFPCDASGRVDLDTLSERGRIDYFYARTVIGREFTRRVLPVGLEA